MASWWGPFSLLSFRVSGIGTLEGAPTALGSGLIRQTEWLALHARVSRDTWADWRAWRR